MNRRHFFSALAVVPLLPIASAQAAPASAEFLVKDERFARTLVDSARLGRDWRDIIAQEIAEYDLREQFWSGLGQSLKSRDAKSLFYDEVDRMRTAA